MVTTSRKVLRRRSRVGEPCRNEPTLDAPCNALNDARSGQNGFAEPEHADYRLAPKSCSMPSDETLIDEVNQLESNDYRAEAKITAAF